MKIWRASIEAGDCKEFSSVTPTGDGDGLGQGSSRDIDSAKVIDVREREEPRITPRVWEQVEGGHCH
jgi:hypothetical protein